MPVSVPDLAQRSVNDVQQARSKCISLCFISPVLHPFVSVLAMDFYTVKVEVSYGRDYMTHKA